MNRLAALAQELQNHCSCPAEIRDTPTSPIFKVRRSDGLEYITSDVTKIGEEPNDDWRRLQEIHITCDTNHQTHLELRFSIPCTTLILSGVEKEAIETCNKAIHEFLAKAICTRLSERRLRHRITLALASIILPSVLLTWFLVFESKAKGSSEIVAASIVSLMLLGVLIKEQLALGSTITERIERSLFPRSLFMFGNEYQRQKRREHIRDNLIWAVGVAAFISIMTNLITWLITDRLIR